MYIVVCLVLAMLCAAWARRDPFTKDNTRGGRESPRQMVQDESLFISLSIDGSHSVKRKMYYNDQFLWLVIVAIATILSVLLMTSGASVQRQVGKNAKSEREKKLGFCQCIQCKNSLLPGRLIRGLSRSCIFKISYQSD